MGLSENEMVYIYIIYIYPPNATFRRDYDDEPADFSNVQTNL